MLKAKYRGGLDHWSFQEKVKLFTYMEGDSLGLASTKERQEVGNRE